jgi:hypothetical protein
MGVLGNKAGVGADAALGADARDGDQPGTREIVAAGAVATPSATDATPAPRRPVSKALAGTLIVAAIVLFGVSTAGGMAALAAYRATSNTTQSTTPIVTESPPAPTLVSPEDAGGNMIIVKPN